MWEDHHVGVTCGKDDMRSADRLEWKIISITGHREVSPQGKSTIRRAMHAMVKNPTIDAIYFGGARGADTLALCGALEARQGTRPWLVVVVPDKAESQPYEARQWFHKADEVIELGNPIDRSDGFRSFHLRNEYLVNVATKVVAFHDGRSSGGTVQAMKYAESHGVVVLTVKV